MIQICLHTCMCCVLPFVFPHGPPFKQLTGKGGGVHSALDLSWATASFTYNAQWCHD